MSDRTQVNRLWANRASLWPRGCSFTLSSPRAPSKNHPCSCVLLGAESPGRSSRIHGSVSWSYTFTLGITQIELPPLTAGFPVKPLAPLIYFLSLFIFYLLTAGEHVPGGQEVYATMSYSPHSISQSTFANRHLVKGVRCVLAVAKVESLFKKEISAPFLWQQSWTICHLIQPYTYVSR